MQEIMTNMRLRIIRNDVNNISTTQLISRLHQSLKLQTYNRKKDA